MLMKNCTQNTNLKILNNNDYIKLYKNKQI